MKRIRNATRKPLGSAVVAGLVVALFGWIATAAVWNHSDYSSSADDRAAHAPTPPPKASPASQQKSSGLTVNQIYQADGPGVAFVQSTLASQPASPLNPFGGSSGGTATGSGFVIDHQGHILTNAHVVNG